MKESAGIVGVVLIVVGHGFSSRALFLYVSHFYSSAGSRNLGVMASVIGG